MPMRYAHTDDVLNQLKLSASNPAHATQIARLERLENGLCDAFNEKVGTSFGAIPDEETRTVQAVGSPLIALKPNARSVSQVAVGGIWDGAVWADETVLDLGDWIEWRNGPTGNVIAIAANSGVWFGPVRVTGIWDDQPTEVVPADVREALTFITIDEYRVRNASPAGEIGPDGLAIPVRNPWRFTFVRSAIDRHRVRRVKVGV